MMNTRSKLIPLVITATLVRCIIAVCVDLGNDEVYYLAYAQKLQWNYFDHPPMVALLIRISTFNLYLINEFFIRLGPIILAAANTVLIYDMVKKIKDEQAAFIAALLFTASPYCSIIAGTFILPDSVQLFFWILSMSLLVNIIYRRPGSKKNNSKLIWFGITAGLCVMCKVHGIFLWFGFGAYILVYQRSLLKNPYLYVAILVTALIISPILFWNIQNNFITYNFHSSRVAVNNGIQPGGFIRELAGSIFYNNPFNFLLILIALFSLFKQGHFIAGRVKRLLLFLSMPLILLLLAISLFRDTLPHWSGPAYISLIIIAACFISHKATYDNKSGKRLKQVCVASTGFLMIVIMAGILMINFLPGTIGKKEAAFLGDGDFTLDMYGWNAAKKDFKSIYQTNFESGISSTTFVISNKWFPGAHIDHYIAKPLHLDFIAIGDLNDIHTYAWLNRNRKRIKAGEDAYFITFSNNFCDPAEKYKGIFKEIAKPVIIEQARSGRTARIMFIYLLKNYNEHSDEEAIMLPGKIR